MKILLVTPSGDGIGLLYRFQREHNDVLALKSAKAREAGDGIVPVKRVMKITLMNVLTCVNTFHPELVIFDMVGYGKIADHLRKKRIPCIGGGTLNDKIELDRAYGQAVMKACGITIPETHQFDGIEEAKKFIASSGKRWVYKPLGNKAVEHTYVSQDPKSQDLLEWIDKMYTTDKSSFLLQEFVDGVEISCEGWFNGRDGTLWNWTMEEKKFMNDGVGPTIGCAGCVVGMATPQSKIVQDGIKKVEAFLRKGGYIGALDLNTIVKDDKFYGLEWTARFGYDAIYALAEIIDFKLLDLFHCMSTNSSFRYRFTTEYGAAVRVSIPPYPEGKDYSDDIPIQGLNSENLKHIWVGDMRFKDGMFYTAGADGVPLVVSAKGVDVKEATRRCYRTISNLRIPDMQYRTDIGKRVREQLQKKWIF